MLCFFHSNDLDGACSGAIVNYLYRDCDMIGIDYGDEFPWHRILSHERVYMVDFSLQPFEEMIKLRNLCDLVWIDHHESAIKDYEEWGTSSGKGILGLRDTSKAACELTWEVIFGYAGPIPRAVTLLGRYDVWDHSDPDVMPFQWGMRAFADTSPTNQDFWVQLFTDDEFHVDQVIEKGSVLLDYRDAENAKYIKKHAFATEFEGLRVIACNRGIANSQLFDSVYDPEYHDIMMTFCLLPSQQWTISLYSTKDYIDVSVIAKKYGGGGHAGAAGFQCEELPF